MSSETFDGKIFWGPINERKEDGKTIREALTITKQFTLKECEFISLRKDAEYFKVEDATHGISAKVLTQDTEDFYDWFHSHTKQDGWVEITLPEGGEDITRYFQFIDGEIISVEDTYSRNEDRCTRIMIAAQEIRVPDSITRKDVPPSSPFIYSQFNALMLGDPTTSNQVFYYNSLMQIIDYKMFLGTNLEDFTGQYGRHPQYVTITLRNQMTNAVRQHLYDYYLRGLRMAMSIIINPEKDTSGLYLNTPKNAYVLEGHILEIHEKYSSADVVAAHLPVTVKMSVKTLKVLVNGTTKAYHHV